LTRALAHDPGDAQASTSMGLLALARHQFVGALQWGDRARQLDPAGARPLGIIGDAQIELGRYPEAVRTFQAMVDRRPDLSSYARVSYARELFGDVDGAIAAMQQAVEAGGAVPENGAYTRVLLANLYFNGGRLAEAEAAYRRALFDQLRYPYALAGLARVEAMPMRQPVTRARLRRRMTWRPPSSSSTGRTASTSMPSSRSSTRTTGAICPKRWPPPGARWPTGRACGVPTRSRGRCTRRATTRRR